MRLNFTSRFFLIIAFSFFFAQIIYSQTHYFTITIDGAQANAGAGTGSAGTGTGKAVYNETTMTLSVEGDFTGLTGTSTNAHIHDAPAGSNGGVVFGLIFSSGVTSGTFSGSGVLDGTEETALLSDGMYFNLHSTEDPGGEIRGQVLLSAVKEFTITIDGAQANAGAGTGSAGTGSGNGIFYENTNELIVSGNFTGLTGTSTNAHIHDAPAGSNGGVVFGLTFSSGVTSGTFSGSGILDGMEAIDLCNDGMYFNLHSTEDPGGEIRGQLLLSVVKEFTISLDGAQANGGAGTGSAGTGLGIAKFYENTNELIVSGDFMGLTGAISNAHVHDAPAGSNGGVVFGLAFTSGMSGTFSGSGILDGMEAMDLCNDGMYVNLHSSEDPGGEIRGQIILIEEETCLANLDLDGNPIIADTYSAIVINSEGTVLTGTTVVFEGEESIFLNTGFVAESGCNFTALIAVCAPSTFLGETTEYSQQENNNASSNIKFERSNELNIYPNPSSEEVFFEFEMEEESNVNIRIIDMLGGTVEYISKDQLLGIGNHKIKYNINHLAIGNYTVVFNSGKKVFAKQLIVQGIR